MKVYVVCHDEIGNYIGHGLDERHAVADGIYFKREDAEYAVMQDEEHECWINEVEIT